jgi:insecticidal toxin complex protein TccC
VERQAFDAAGRRVAQWDARLWALQEGPVPLANQVVIPSLSGQVLASKSIDAGWRVALLSETGLAKDVWDGRGSHVRTDYDSLLRPVAVYEQAADEPECCVERLTYGGPSEADGNRCGQVLRHDDPAGTRHWPDYGIRGQALTEGRAFLQTLETPDWAEDEIARDALLEPEVYTTAWTHDAFGAVLTQVDARGHKQRQAYTVAGQLSESALTLSGEAELCLVQELTYSAFGQIESQTAGNGVRSTATYSPADGRLLHLMTSRSDGIRLQSLSYGYDPVGNVLRIKDSTVANAYFANRKTDGVSTYAYDSLYQLIEASGRESPSAGVGPGLPGIIPLPGGADPSVLTPYSERYTYDAGGNLTSLTHQGQQNWTRRMAVAPGSNRSLPWPQDSPAPDIEAGFDANGNLQSLEGQPLAWDVRNQLKQATQLSRQDGPMDRERYVYDGGNWRVRKIILRQAKAITHVAEVRYLPGLELRTDSVTGEVLDVVTTSAGRARVRALRWHAGLPQDIHNDQLRYEMDDHLGSAVLELDSQARLMSREGYYPYGGTAWRAARNTTEAKYKVIRYSGQERDATGLSYYGFRYYAPWLQRWINPDPAGAVDGLNLYRMVQNNPVSLRDAEGLAPLLDPFMRDVDQAKSAAQKIIGKTIEILETGSNPGIEVVMNLFFGDSSPERKMHWKEDLGKVQALMDDTNVSRDFKDIPWREGLTTVAQIDQREYQDFRIYRQSMERTVEQSKELSWMEKRKLISEKKVDLKDYKGAKFLQANKENWQQLRQITDKDFMAQTIIHEFSHTAAGTEDYVYGKVLSGMDPSSLYELPQGQVVPKDQLEAYRKKLQGGGEIDFHQLAYENADSFAYATTLLSFAESKQAIRREKYQNLVTSRVRS